MNYLKVFSPARFDLAGGTLDLPPISSIIKNSTTINCTLDKGVYVTFEKSEKIILRNENTGIEEIFPSIHSDLLLFSKGVEFFKEFIKFPFKLIINSELPRGSGLGVSSVILVTILKGIARLFSIEISDKKLVYIAANIESSIINCPAGLQDYIAPLYGGLNKISFPHNGFVVENIGLTEELKRNILFIYTDISHFSGKPNWELLKLFIDDLTYRESFMTLAKNAESISQELSKNNIEIVGKMMKMDFKIRESFPVKLIPYLPALFSILERCDRISGFKLCGAAGGGTIAIMTKDGKFDDTKEMLDLHGFSVLELRPSNKKFEVLN